MKIEYLIDHTRFIPEIAELKYNHYRSLAPEKTLGDFHNGLKRDLSDGGLPVAFVVVEKEKYVASFSLRINDLESHKHLTPWLGGLFVHPAMRNQGIGTGLVKEAKSIVKTMGYDCLYLYTSEKANWYTKLGWEPIENSFLNQGAITIMKT